MDGPFLPPSECICAMSFFFFFYQFGLSWLPLKSTLLRWVAAWWTTNMASSEGYCTPSLMKIYPRWRPTWACSMPLSWGATFALCPPPAPWRNGMGWGWLWSIARCVHNDTWTWMTWPNGFQWGGWTISRDFFLTWKIKQRTASISISMYLSSVSRSTHTHTHKHTLKCYIYSQLTCFCRKFSFIWFSFLAAWWYDWLLVGNWLIGPFICMTIVSVSVYNVTFKWN